MESVMDMAKMAFGSDTLGKLSSWLGQSPSETKAAMQDAIPVSMVGLADQASSEEGSRALLSKLQQGDYPHLDPDDLSRAAGDAEMTERLVESGQGFTSGMFGGKLGGLIDGMATHTGVSRSGVSRLLGLAAPLVMGIIGKQAVSNNLDARGLRNYLGEQRNIATRMLPGPLANMLSPRRAVVGTAVAGRRAFPWRVVGLLVVVVALGWAVARIGRRDTVRSPATVRTPITEPMAAPTATLSGGDVSALNRWLEGSGSVPQRFVLDVRFNTDSAEIEPASRALLIEVGSALSTHQNAKIRLEGHTDNTGSPQTNHQLSQARADAARGYLIERGIDAGRIEAAGFGSERPIASNDTAEGRAQNRRTELVVISR